MAITIRYDGQVRPSSLITYTDIPNILKVEDTGAGTKATFTITISGNLAGSTTSDGQWYISFLGDTITNVTSAENAISKNFYISSSNNSTAASICRALRNCPTVAANFNAVNTNNTVTMTAKANGPIFSGITNYFETNISSSYLTTGGTDGTAESSLFGSKIDVDVYSDGEYITTLEKNYYGSEVAFNLSPVLTTITKIGKSTPYNLNISKIASNGDYGVVGDLPVNYSVVGYMVNQGYKFQYIDRTSLIAQNVQRGKNRDVYNNSLLYVYEPEIVLSFYSTVANREIDVYYRDSALNVIDSFDFHFTSTDSDNLIKTAVIPLSGTGFTNAFYVDVKFENSNDRIRYNVIKPLKMTEYCQRIYFRNSYGGVSFFDFTGAKTETRDLDVMTYEKNIFDYYDSEMNDLEKVYDNTVKYQVTLKSHLFEKDGKYIFNDMLQSPEAWVVRNGEKYEIIIDSISVEETSNDNIYEATVKFHYSQEPSLI